MSRFWWGLMSGSIVTLVLQKFVWPRKRPDEEFTHFGSQIKDIIYIFEVKPVYRFRYISPSLDFYLGDGVVSKSYEDPYVCFHRIHPDDHRLLVDKVSGKVNYEEAIPQRWRTNDGRYLRFEEYTTPIYEKGEIVAVQGIIRNVEATVVTREMLEYESRHDDLTGVLNRRAFNEAVLSLSPKGIGAIVVDLNDLKKMNDEKGHLAGDALLQKAALVLLELSTQVYRIGGDEFVLLVNTPHQEVLLDLTVSIQEKFELNHISAAVGAAWEEQLVDFNILYDQADQNMYEQKRRSETHIHASG